MDVLKPRDDCPKCQTGRLNRTLKQQGGVPCDTREMILDKLYKTWWVVGVLQCEDCSATFPCLEQGKRVEEDLLEPRLATFVNPAEEPSVCPHCNKDEIWHATCENQEITERFLAGPNIPQHPGDISYRFCASCLVLVWVFPTTT